MRFSLLLPLVLLALGCGLDYEKALLAEKLTEDFPNTVLLEFSHRVVKNGKEVFRVSGEKGELFEEKRQALFYGVSFNEYDTDGVLITWGVCSNARVYTDTDNVELWGGLDFYSSKDEASLQGESLFWDDAASILTGSDEELIRIQRESDTTIEGRGFFADINTRAVKFQGDTFGSWVDDEE